MSAFNGSGSFVISGVGLPYVTGTTISSSVANQLNTDLATGLSNCVTKDGQTTPTANIPMGSFKLTGVALATATGDALSYGQAATVTALTATTQLIGKGTATNDSAAAGYIGEWIEGSVIRGAGGSYTTTVAANVTTISLTAGDWNICGFVGVTTSGGACTQFSAGASSTTAAIPTFGQNGLAGLQGGISATDTCISIAGRLSVAVTTTIYLVGNATFPGSATAYGYIGARRAR